MARGSKGKGPSALKTKKRSEHNAKLQNKRAEQGMVDSRQCKPHRPTTRQELKIA